MITAKILILVITFGMEYLTINGVLEYLDKKKYAKDDEEYIAVMERLQTMKKEVV